LLALRRLGPSLSQHHTTRGRAREHSRLYGGAAYVQWLGEGDRDHTAGRRLIITLHVGAARQVGILPDDRVTRIVVAVAIAVIARAGAARFALARISPWLPVVATCARAEITRRWRAYEKAVESGDREAENETGRQFHLSLARATGIDVRFAFLLCLAVGAHLLRQAARRAGRSEGVADLVGLLFLFVPRLAFVIKYSHSEPVTGLLLAAAVYALVAEREILGLIVLGACLSSKQYLAMVAPLPLLYCRTPRRLLWLGAGAAAPWLPFLVWGPRALWLAGFQIHMDRLVRKDALTFSAWLIQHELAPLPRWIGVVAGLLASTVQGLRARPSTAGLFLGMAAALVVMLALSPQAFQNYYVLVVWMLLAALAAAPAEA